MMKTFDDLIDLLPYGKDFLFVDSIESIDDNTIIGYYTFSNKLPFYNSHFKNNPIVPGVIMIETMGQIGMVCHLLYLLKGFPKSSYPILSNLEAEFFNNANYNEKVKVIGKKIYFRKNILKSTIEMRKMDNTLVSTLKANISLTLNQHE